MIIRILGEGQYTVADAALDGLNELDETLQAAVEAGDEQAFAAALDALLRKVRTVGDKLPDDELTGSDFVLPSSDATVEEVRELLGEEGLIPG